jgi:hypothetical protein
MVNILKGTKVKKLQFLFIRYIVDRFPNLKTIYSFLLVHPMVIIYAMKNLKCMVNTSTMALASF